MKRTISFPWIALAAITLLFPGCSNSEKKPSTKDFEKQFSVELPAYVRLSSFDIEASENVGSKVEPLYKARFKATIRLKTPTYELANKEDAALFVRPVAEEGDSKEIYGMAGAHLSAGRWAVNFSLENDPIPGLGHPKDFFSGGKVIVVGSQEEIDFRNQQRQKQLAAQQEADNAAKIHQMEAEKENAERERRAEVQAAEIRRFRESSPFYLVGQWNWASGRDKFRYTMSITSHTPDGQFTGYLSDGNGKIVGKLRGDNVEFTRILTRFGDQEQTYTGKLVGVKPNLKMVHGTWTGAFEGNGDGSDWHAEMTSQ